MIIGLGNFSTSVLRENLLDVAGGQHHRVHQKQDSQSCISITCKFQRRIMDVIATLRLFELRRSRDQELEK
jgi:hypothetical protein